MDGPVKFGTLIGMHKIKANYQLFCVLPESDIKSCET